ncbi:unnamed protein product [Effrenium voratum]|uniref:Uncharacterized protein n=1 Tax=Effrenium voratum TaxID=2562239 RepID=A0AA36JGT7_9DINO|nr:unnamed protein product [Effrenium voratum]
MKRETLHIVMDWAEGGTLAAVLSAQRVEGRTVTEAWACSAAQQMCAALAYIHQKGVVHCDLKPENAMLLRAIDVRRNEAPHVLLVDFGIAEIVEARQPAGPLKVRGTAVYLAPEGFEGHLTEKSDLWALGVVIFEMLLGRRPFQADNIAVLWCKVVQSEVPLKELSALSAEVVQGLLNKDPIARLTAQECRSLAWFAQPLHLTEPEEKSARPVKLEGLGSANCFHQIATFAVATGLSMKDMPSVFQVFQSIDQDKSGNLDFEEFRSALARLDITEDPQRLMAILDMDQNGRISYTEFLAAVLSSSMDTVPEKMIQEAFDVFDVDGDGEISLSELRVMMSGDGPLVEVLPNGQTVDEVMEEIAGSKSSISFKDFMKYLSRISRRRRRSSDFAAKHGGDSSQAGMQMVDSMCEELEAEEAEVEEVEEDIPEEDTPEFPALGYTDKEEHPPEVDTEAEETAFWRAFGPSKEHWALKRPQSGGPTALAMPLEGDAGALPPMHEFLLELCGGPRDMEEQRKALNCLLRFPEQKISVEQTDVLAAHISTMNQHFIGGMVLTRLLAEDTPLYELQEKLRQALEAMQIETKPITRRRKEQIAEHEKQEPQVYSPPGSPRTSPPARMSPKSSPPPKESPAPVRLKSRPAESRAWGARLPPQDDFREARLAELRRKQRPPRLRVRQTPSREAPSRGRDYLMDKDTIQEIFLPRLVLGPAKRAVQTGQSAELKPGRSLKPRRAGPTISLRRG